MKVLCAAAVSLSACVRPYYSGAVDLARAQRGEVYVDTVRASPGQYMLRAVAEVDAPPWRILNMYADPEAQPYFNTGVQEVRLQRQGPDFYEADVTPRNMLWHRFGPTTMMMRLDRAHGEVTFTLLESDWARGAQWVSKLEPLGNGERTLLTAYAHADVKLWWADVAVQWEAGTVYDSIQNIRRVVMLPKYGTPPAAAPAEVAARSKVVVPGFRAEGVPEETARTLTRVFAEQLMRGGNWNIVTQDEAVALLDYAQKAQLAGCAGETACAIDIGRALEASLIVHGSVGKVGETYVLSAALLKLPAGTVERRVSEQADGEGALLERVRAAAVELARP